MLDARWRSEGRSPPLPTAVLAAQTPPLRPAESAAKGLRCNRRPPGKEAMRGYKDQKLDERLARAAEARQKALEKFKSRPGPDDPAVIAKAAERKAIAEARELRDKARAEIKAKEAAERAEREAKEKVEREARERREAVEKVIRDAAEAAERKAERDRRYAARKQRQTGKR